MKYPLPRDHNQPPSLTEVVKANMETAVWLLCKEALVTAIQDRRLERSHLRVLAVIAEHMDKATATAAPSRQVIAAAIGVEVSTVSNVLSELRFLGYLVSEKRHDEDTNRKLTFYSFGRIDHETIRRELAIYFKNLRENGGQKSSPPTVNFAKPKPKESSPSEVKFPAHGEVQSSPPTVKFPASGEQSTVQKLRSESYSLLKSLDSNIEIIPSTPPPDSTSPPTVKSEKAKKGARLPEDWMLPRRWGNWALETYDVTAPQVRREAERFKNHWLSKAGKDATKIDWERTWHNWCDSDIRGWKRRVASTDAAPELTAVTDEYTEAWDKARAMLGGDDES